VSLAGKAQTLLGLVVSTAAEEGVSLPARRYVAAGTPGSEAHDCPDGQVTVALGQVYGNLAATQGDGFGMSGDPAAVPVSSVTYGVQVAIPHPVPADDGAPPSAAALDTAGAASLDVAWVLKRVRDKLMTSSTLTGGLPAGVRLSAVTPSGPSGGLVALNLTVTVDLL
jgi:hypothetical protein